MASTITKEENRQLSSLLMAARRLFGTILDADELATLRRLSRQCRELNSEPRDSHGMLKLQLALQTLRLFAEAIDPDRNVLLAILLLYFHTEGLDSSNADFNSLCSGDVKALVEGLEAVNRFSATNIIANQDNYRGLLLAMAGDIRVIIVLIVRCLALMREINHHPDTDWVRQVAFEANYLYAQLAHRMGLYKVKGELEDLALKYTNREVYTHIARKLNETKRERDAYVAAFIAPVKEQLEKAGLKFEIKGRTKSISSIWAKIQKQKVDLGGIYDLFAIRVILDTEAGVDDKRDCWTAFGIVTAMYTHNPARMRNWLSIPKSNGYESLHCTVNGPDNKWVEVQIRSRRMDDVAEKGLAAHWRYKGGHADPSDAWMRNVREILETASAGPMELVKNTKKGIYSDEVYVFTPKGDVNKLPEGSTVLDFAFAIHTRIGSQCVGAIVNGRHEKISYRLKSGDTVEVVTSSSQSPKQDWLNIVVTSKARNKIRQTLNEARIAKANLGKELLDRRAKNRKIEFDEAALMKVVKKLGYKFANDFYADLADEKIDPARVIADYQAILAPIETENRVSADEFQLKAPEDDKKHGLEDVVTIGEGSIKGMKYKFPRCCSPVHGDDVFGFISLTGVINIHKTTCPNAEYIKKRYADRLISVKWSGAQGHTFPATLQVTGTDDIGIVTNITSIINKEPGVTLRGISIDSHDGLFRGYLTVGVADTGQLKQLTKKIATVKGVKSVTRQ